MSIPELLKFTREFPASIEFLLPLRHSIRFYDNDGGSSSSVEEQPGDGFQRELKRGDVRYNDLGADLQLRRVHKPEGGLGGLYIRV